MRARAGELKPGSVNSSRHNIADCFRTRELAIRGSSHDKAVARLTRATVETQVSSHGGTDIARHWQPVPTPALSSDGEFTSGPVNIIQAQREDFTRAQPESRQQEQDGSIAPADVRSLIARGDHTSHLFRSQ
jgi:hypothetical protein